MRYVVTAREKEAHTETNLQAHRVRMLYACDATEGTHTLSQLRTQSHECPRRLYAVFVRNHPLSLKRHYEDASIYLSLERT